MLFRNTVLSSFCGHQVPILGTRFGLELECEGGRLPYRPGTFECSDLDDENEDEDHYRPETVPASWSTIPDHSLRGMGIEYVLTTPLSLADAETALDDLRDGFIQCDSLLKPSTRTSTHIHINVQDFTVRDLANFLTLYLLVEDALFEAVAPIRRKNLFCWRVRHAPGLIPFWRAALIKGGMSDCVDGLHYSGLSIFSLWKYGTLEFRALEGVDIDPGSWEKVKTFLRVFDNIRRLSLTYENPTEILAELEETGPHRLAEKIALRFFGPLFGTDLFRTVGTGAKRTRLLIRGLDWAQPPANQPGAHQHLGSEQSVPYDLVNYIPPIPTGPLYDDVVPY